MSSILDALEKANQKRAGKDGTPISNEELAQQSTRERRLRQEADKQRHIMRIMLFVSIAIIVLAGGTVAVLLMRGPRTEKIVAPPETQIAAIPVATPSPTSKPAPTATPEPAPTPWPRPTPWPSPTPPPQPRATATPAREFDRNSYKGIFKDGQIVRPEELGLTISGVVKLGGNYIAIINDKNVKAGQKIGALHVVSIDERVITVLVEENVQVKVRL
ncbi:hypothetical protein BH09SUM1_BH09SUM1_18330 [soil metagenome]